MLDEIKDDIAALGVADVYALLNWLPEYASDRWDQQIEADCMAGTFDPLFEQVMADHLARRKHQA